MAKTLSSSAVAEIQKLIDGVTADPHKIPGCVMVVVGKDGKTIFSHASGNRGIDTQDPMTMDTTFWIASCTKMIGAIACMQLVEQGKLALDDADLVEKVCPELKDIKILKNVDEKGKPEYVDKKERITLKMLLTHTAGFGYTFFKSDLKRCFGPIGCDELSGDAKDVLGQPLVHEPGSTWEYGVGMDWAGTMVERVSGMSLNDYFQEHIFQPLGIENINMFPTEQMKSKLAYMHAKSPDKKIVERDHSLRRALTVNSADDVKKTYNSAGVGCFARPEEYCQILATLLNDGTSPTTGAQILKPETVKEMFTNQIPDMPNFGRQLMSTTKPELSNTVKELYPQPHDEPQGWGLSCMLTIHPGPTGRGGNTGWWAGLPNLFWWCDREKGVAGIICSQIIPFGDADVLRLWGQTEAAIYGNLG